MKKYLKLWRKPNGEIVEIYVNHCTGFAGEFNSYGWELLGVWPLTIYKHSKFDNFDLSKFVDLRECVTFGIKGAILFVVLKNYKK